MELFLEQIIIRKENSMQPDVWKLNEFIDEIGTKFIKGPFEVNNKKYDYKLIDKDGEDYCTIDQIKNWNIKLKV